MSISATQRARLGVFVIVGAVMYANGGFDSITSNWHIFVALLISCFLLLFKRLKRLAWIIYSSVVIGVIINGVIF